MFRRFSDRIYALGMLILVTAVVQPTPGRCGAPVRAGNEAVNERVAEIRNLIGERLTRLEALYKHLHTHPELSLQEVRTAARLEQEMKEIGFEVTPRVGGTGLVAVLKNGQGPTVLVRTDMDALPVLEKTGLAYASKVRPAATTCT